MIEEQFLHSCILPWILFDQDGLAMSSDDGVLFKRPPSLQERFYRDQGAPRLGWTQCRNNYAQYTLKLLHMPTHTLMLYGLKVHGVSTAKGRAETLSIKCQKEEVETYILSLIATATVVDQTFIQLTRSNIHEVRSINSQIYGYSESVKMYFDKNPALDSKQHENIKSIVKLSGTLRRRSDFLDVIANPQISEANQTKLLAYKNFDMARRSLNGAAEAKNVRTFMTGQSVGKVLGYGHFDQIAYQLIENAIKYSPSPGTVEIHFEETPKEIFVRISSLGPPLDRSEEGRMFQFGFRGINAQKVTEHGSGVGLYFTKNLVETKHSGRIHFYQEIGKSAHHDGLIFCPTHFNLRFPRAE